MGGHHHHHHHNHGSEVKPFDRAFFIAITANGLFVLLQIIFAYFAHSTSLLADAIHNMGDVLSLVFSWVGQRLLTQLPTQKTTYGMKKTSILAALANGILLVFSSGVIVTEATYKLFSPSQIETGMVIFIATLGIFINAGTALLFMRGSKDLNIRSAFLHLMYDAFISLGVVVSALLIYFTGWLRIDPIVGLLIAFVIVRGTWSLFSDSFRLIIDGVPREISTIEVRTYLEGISEVKNVHDLHIWAMSTQENALSVHLWMPEHPLSDEKRKNMLEILAHRYNIHHATIQVERDLQYCLEYCDG